MPCTFSFHSFIFVFDVVLVNAPKDWTGSVVVFASFDTITLIEMDLLYISLLLVSQKILYAL